MTRHETPDVSVRISLEGMRRQETAPTAQVIDLEPQRIKRFQDTWNRDHILMRRLRGEKQW